jgi:hypothetical protein
MNDALSFRPVAEETISAPAPSLKKIDNGDKPASKMPSMRSCLPFDKGCSWMGEPSEDKGYLFRV